MGRIDTIVDWMLTERCNLNCYYCLQNADTRKAECGPVGRFAENVRPDNFLFINASVLNDGSIQTLKILRLILLQDFVLSCLSGRLS